MRDLRVNVGAVIAPLALVLSTACHPATSPTSPAPTPVAPSPGAVPTVAVAPTPPVRIGACGHQSYSLGPPVRYASARATGDLAIGDINGDGKVDLVIGDVDAQGRGQIDVMFGNGDGTFTAPAKYALLAGGEADSIALADFDTDNDLDIIMLGGSGTPQIFLNNSDGTFGAPIALPTPPGGGPAPGRSGTVRVVDLDNDNKPEIVEHVGGRLLIWYDSGHAQFTSTEPPAIRLFDHAAGLAVADFDHDGTADLALAGNDRSGGAIAVLLGRRNRTFAPPTLHAAGAVTGKAAAVVAADFDGDHKIDLAALFAGPSGGTIAVFPGAGNGAFGAATTLSLPSASERSRLIAADVNGDGKADLIATTLGGVAVYLSNGKTFQEPVMLPGTDASALAAGDLRGDHTIGLAATEHDASVSVWPGTCQ